MDSKKQTSANLASAAGLVGGGLACAAFVPGSFSAVADPRGTLRGSGSASHRAGPAAQAASGSSIPAFGAVAGLAGIATYGASRRGENKTSRCAEWVASEQPGATAPLGLFDPLGLGRTEERFNKMRVSEIKHGRVAMMASLGAVFQHVARLPGFEKSPAGLGALSDPAALAGLGVVFLVSGFLEVGPWADEYSTEPGNYGDPAGFAIEYGGLTKEFRNKEINNGRMAMMAVMGQFSAEAFTGQDAYQQIGLGALPARAVGASSMSLLAGRSNARGTATARKAFDPTKEAGVTAPFGFFDPAGFVDKEDYAGFRKLRSSEIKHGRVAMMASLGLLVQSAIKLPGFDGVPAGLGAQFSAPGSTGLWAVSILSGLVEVGLNQWRENPMEPGNYGDPMNLGNYTMEMRNKELNNGRMAMFAVIGIIAAEAYSGQPAINQL